MSSPADPPDWGAFDVSPIDVAKDFRLVPTGLYNAASAKHDASPPFTDALDLFNRSRLLASAILSHNHDETLRDPTKAYSSAIQHLFTNAVDNEDHSEVVIHALRLVHTPPGIFGGCFQLKGEDDDVSFTFDPFVDPTIDPTLGAQRHDVAQWLACLDVLGKVFQIDGWTTAAAVSLLPRPDPSQQVLRIAYGKDVVFVTREARDAMVDAVNENKNKPTLLNRMKYIMIAVSKILNLDMTEHSMPQTKSELDAFNWDAVIPGKKKDYPQGKAPTDEECAKVRTVFADVKNEKDERARANGFSGSGVQSYVSVRQRWKQYRDIHALYRHMNPSSTLQMVEDLVTVRLKNCTSLEAMDDLMSVDVEKHLSKIKRERRKKEKEREIKRLQAEAAAAEQAEKERSEQVDTELETLVNEVEVMQGTPALTARGRPARQGQAKKKKDQDLKRKRDEIAMKQQEKQEAEARAKERAKERAELLEQEKEFKARAAITPKKRAERKDVNNLNRILTPRKKASVDGASWKPPTRRPRESVHDEPGANWKKEALEKLQLLTILRQHLTFSGLLNPTLTFPAMMDYVEANDLCYNSRVFLYLLTLMLSQKSGFGEVVAIVLNFIHEGLTNPTEVMNADSNDVQQVISDHDDKNLIGPAIVNICTELSTNHGDQIPQDKAGLVHIGLDDTVASLLCHHVFGISDLVVGLHARKILAATDMLDWEETGAEEKMDVKMAKLPQDRVRKSLQTWLPKGQALQFHDTMDAIGSLISNQRSGDWGKIKTAINSNFNPKDKRLLDALTLNINQFYEATKGGGHRSSYC